ncbi:MAG: Precorrin-2 oxidase @ Sirohydrochlorin ferrochelatase activity of CysG / Uroporphyrinogen-III methyltransferase [uncultured Rubellimicrobium sp.]|uniref:Precorrin-2 oxidase @ Sirohydrochlorin ferrochelatase activity of CysG / Uroporphyrinogen-III methyltransferase n=1 Tax=uncultured Rubellimicrobium sp. TaxID=543078 RepID=A0A6J4NE36_9RHOB|nr:MAG: Precorrin-2 oxidase @ Sirohydrochlorin ferrochelatase activity of CysG / Uroporphyrinogen-III methyltransferase [uncultured Rubellimicrobium sp.]
MRNVSTPPSDAPAAPARVEPLSVLPVFFDLHGKRALVAGGTDPAAWKAELLAAAGAEVTVAATDLDDEMARLVMSGTVQHLPQDWTPDLLRGCALAIADEEDPERAQAFVNAARAAAVPVNVIDNPTFCQFQFGSVVNRSPVVVGISTTGAAPILGQAVRRRIETLLPRSLSQWAALAQALRDTVAERLTPGPARRAFWEALVDRAFGAAPQASAQADLLTLLDAPARTSGHVTFVGAGPGDPEHLTLKAVRALQAADVILFDDLVSDEVLELARREAKRILVGKRAGRPSCQQSEINDMMVTLAKAGRRVVRLKSGDPMIFGRAGEEIAVLRSHGLPYDVVPGVTAAQALASSLGRSLTHRDHAKSVRLVTGHSRHGGLPEDLDWRALADPSATTVFYMGGRMSAEISRRLIGLGLSPATPAAIGCALGRPGERTILTRLDELAAAVASCDPSEPLLIGLGQAFASAAALSQADDDQGVAPQALHRRASA